MVTKRESLTKQDILKSVEALPDDVTINEVIDHLCYLSGIEEGLADVEASRKKTHEELLERIKSRRGAGEETTTLRQEVIESLARLPEDATAADIEYRVHVVLILTQRLAEAAAGSKLTDEEARERLKHWLE